MGTCNHIVMTRHTQKRKKKVNKVSPLRDRFGIGRSGKPCQPVERSEICEGNRKYRHRRCFSDDANGMLMIVASRLCHRKVFDQNAEGNADNAG